MRHLARSDDQDELWGGKTKEVPGSEAAALEDASADQGEMVVDKGDGAMAVLEASEETEQDHQGEGGKDGMAGIREFVARLAVRVEKTKDEEPKFDPLVWAAVLEGVPAE